MRVVKLPKEIKDEIVVHVRAYMEEEIGESIGQLAAENLLHFMLAQLGPHVYNQAIQDARSTLSTQVERLDEELYALQQPLQSHR